MMISTYNKLEPHFKRVNQHVLAQIAEQEKTSLATLFFCVFGFVCVLCAVVFGGA